MKRKSKKWEHGTPIEKTAFGNRTCWGCGKSLEKNEFHCGNCGSFNY
jgi:predicted amidophosphoribosyltransferase